MDLGFADLFFTLCKSLPSLEGTKKFSHMKTAYLFNEEISFIHFTERFLNAHDNNLRIVFWKKGLYFENLSTDENIWRAYFVDGSCQHKTIYGMLSKSPLLLDEKGASTSELPDFLLKIRAVS